MNKQELIENYTMEQLADMIIHLQGQIGELRTRCNKENTFKNFDNHLWGLLHIVSREDIKTQEKSVDKIFKYFQEQKDNAIAIAFTKQIGQLLRDNGVIAHYTETETAGDNELRYGVLFDSLDFSEHDKKSADEIKELNVQIDRKQEEINQIDDILEKFFDIRHDVVGKPDEFEKILEQRIKDGKNIADLLPEEPISAAEILINATRTMGKSKMMKSISKAFGNNSDTFTESMYSVSELRQIANHLLVYCNANKEDKE